MIFQADSHGKSGLESIVEREKVAEAVGEVPEIEIITLDAVPAFVDKAFRGDGLFNRTVVELVTVAAFGEKLTAVLVLKSVVDRIDDGS